MQNQPAELFYKKLFLMILQYSQKNTCVGVSFSILNIAKFLRAPTLKNICERLPLKMRSWNWEKSKSIDKAF